MKGVCATMVSVSAQFTRPHSASRVSGPLFERRRRCAAVATELVVDAYSEYVDITHVSRVNHGLPGQACVLRCERDVSAGDEQIFAFHCPIIGHVISTATSTLAPPFAEHGRGSPETPHHQSTNRRLGSLRSRLHDNREAAEGKG
jgi:hypothetical protein